MIDRRRFRDLMAGVCAPVTVVTTLHDGCPHGSTVSSFTSLSLDPPLVSVAFDRKSTLLPRILETGRFGVNVLGHAQHELATTFARRGVDRFAGTGWYLDADLPRLPEAAGWMACDLHRVVPGGDHLLLFGLVLVSGRSDRPPLVYAHRTFGTHSRFAERPRVKVADAIAACAR
ncbi:flavin reductase family protein [Actinomadura napierensis]|uniref:Flavin reductase like domain-containing protein n=1 Tax=Actinomadura napierensis TaxID=267854 RepID=A0ABP5M672_9ACTN